MTAAVLSLVDDTETQRNLELLATSERKLKSVLENTLAPVCIRDPGGRFTYVNRKFCEFFGVTPEKILGRTSEEVFDKPLAARIRKLDGEVLGSLAPLKTEETYRFNGHVNYYVEKRFALTDHQGAVEGVCTMAFDVTEQIETNRKLLLFKQVISASNEGLLMFEEDDDGADFRSTFITRSAENIFGRSREELEKASLRDVLGYLETEDSGPGLYDRLVEGACRMVEWKTELNGAERWYEMHATVYRPLPGEKERARRDLFCVFGDVTARKENERLQRETQEEIIRAGRLSALGEMAAGLAHEINTPLNVILAQVELLTTDHEFPAASRGALTKIESTVDNIASIIKGLKSMARIDTDRPLEAVRLNELVKDTVNSFMLTLRHKGIRLILDVPDGDFELLGRPAQLGQVLLNLVNNSVDAVQRLEEKWIRIELKREEAFYLNRVTDSGDGIPEQHLSKIMTPFYTTKKTGTGLGLSLSSAIVRQAGGTLTVDASSANTCFEVRLPVNS